MSDIKNTLGRLEEREVARDDRVSRVEAEAKRALEMAIENQLEIKDLKNSQGSNSETLGRWQDLGIKVIGGAILMFVGGLAAKFWGL